MMRSAAILCAVMILAGCAVGPDYKRPDLDLPKSALNSTLLSDKQQKSMAYWWTQYRDPVLNQLIDQALDANLDIALQAQKIREARAELGYKNADLFPSIQGQAEGMRKRVGQRSADYAGGGRHAMHRSDFSVAGSLNYEVDLWGALRRGSEQARAQLLSSAYTKDSIRLQTIADIVTNYMSLRSNQLQVQVTKNTIKARQKQYDLDKNRFKYGAIDKLTLLQTRSALKDATSQLPDLKEQGAKLASSLAILTGKTPSQIMDAANQIPDGDFDDVSLPGDLPVVMPSALVNRRPDIRAAEASLIAANANVGVAKARFFPTFNLSAMIGTGATHVGDLFGSMTKVGQAGGDLTAPILDFGRINAQYRSAKAQKAQAEIQYRQALRQAFKEVRDALAEVKYSRQRLDEIQDQVDSYKENLSLAKTRYEAGRVDYYDVLTAQRNLFSSQLNRADAIANRFTATADLFKALGGGWTDSSDSLTPSMHNVMDSYESSGKDGKDKATAPSVQGLGLKSGA